MNPTVLTTFGPVQCGPQLQCAHECRRNSTHHQANEAFTKNKANSAGLLLQGTATTTANASKKATTTAATTEASTANGKCQQE